MAKLNSLLKIEGTLDGLTFYKKDGAYFVRTKGGVSKSRIANDPAFARTRENGSEFGHSATSGKMLRRALNPVISDAKDNRVALRLTAVMSKVKNADTSSARGERQVSIGIQTPEGKNELKSFNFNKNAILQSILKIPVNLNTTTGEVSMPSFIPIQDVVYPQGTTHLSFSMHVLQLDFSTGNYQLESSTVLNLPISNSNTPVIVQPSAVPSGSGQNYYLLKLEFFQEINGLQYQLNNGAYNATQILEVI